MPFTSGQRIAGIFAWFSLCIACFLIYAILYAFRSTGDDRWLDIMARPAWAPDLTRTIYIWLSVQLLQAAAVWHVWIQREEPIARLAVRFFVAANAMSVLAMVILLVFLNPYCAAIQFVVAWLAYMATLALFWQRSHFAGLLLLPVFLWTTCSAYLNFSIWQMNP